MCLSLSATCIYMYMYIKAVPMRCVVVTCNIYCTCMFVHVLYNFYGVVYSHAASFRGLTEGLFPAVAKFLNCFCLSTTVAIQL